VVTFTTVPRRVAAPPAAFLNFSASERAPEMGVSGRTNASALGSVYFTREIGLPDDRVHGASELLHIVIEGPFSLLA